MLSDIEIAQKTKLKPITEIASKAGILLSELEPYGGYKAKINLKALKRLKNQKDGKLVLVSSINPTKWGEGKTTTTIGLSQALNRIGKRSLLAIREPSLGPCMGVKGGAAGGGYSQVLPMEDINLHFTGDMAAITAAHNLLSAMIDNHIHHGNDLKIDPRHVFFRRVMDMSDRSLRKIVVGLEKATLLNESGFDITAASEVMAILCLSKNLLDMKKRLAEIMVGISYEGKKILAKDLKAQGAMAILLKDAIKPNLVQTIENTPALVHGGPFANIAHGCNSLIATKLGLKLSDILVTEAGFGTDLGAEKFFDIKCRVGELKPAAAVVVVTVRAFKTYGEKNLLKHLENIRLFKVPVIVAINAFQGECKSDLLTIKKACAKVRVKAVISHVWSQGGKGGEELAYALLDSLKKKSSFSPLYQLREKITSKIEKVAKKIYGAVGVKYTPEAIQDLKECVELGFSQLPICVAKTPYSLSDDHRRRDDRFKITVKKIKVSAGARFLVVLTGEVMTMPGLPSSPAAEKMDITENGKIKGLF